MSYSKVNHSRVHTLVLSPVQLFDTPWTAACQVPLSLEFFQARIVLEWFAIPTKEFGDHCHEIKSPRLLVNNLSPLIKCKILGQSF